MESDKTLAYRISKETDKATGLQKTLNERALEAKVVEKKMDDVKKIDPEVNP